MSTSPGEPDGVPRSGLLAVYGAGFAIALSATSIAANLASYLRISHGTLLTLGLLLALYPAAELLLKPIIRALSAIMGPRGVLLTGLVTSVVASGAFVIAEDAFGVGLARLGQGAAAAAVGLGADAVLTRLSPAGTSHSFGGYRTWKAAGYALGPLLGGILVGAGGHSALFLLLAVLAAVLTAWAAMAVPTIDAAAPTSESTTDLVRALFKTAGVWPALALAAGAAAVSVSLGFLPVLATQQGLGPLASGALVSSLVAVAALVQRPVRRIRDAGRLTDHTGIGIGLLLVALGFASASLAPTVAGLVGAGVLVGAGAGVIAPLGFTYLARTNPPERLGQVVGIAEISRLLGAFAAPLLVGAISAASTLTVALLAVTVCLAAAANFLVLAGRGSS
ncbi:MULTISPECIES: MFS transporter [unclassified Mycobacterium]|uniref:MFS transporter n=1 Tax=unclassified Mycobacterium TaxID=2642494 RepID=UPI00048CCC94|nr:MULTISPECIES: MFS transporter [unclassified Mycobacterium]SEA48526.1 Predicted arabinose efflux permease, MFS family [Mycobacterium sp. 283mftsu]